MKDGKRIRIGTSGWHYDHWEGPFYGEGTGAGERLAFYSGVFGTVEINNTFYRMPAKETLETWKDTVDQDFVFSVKASRYITHMKKLKDAARPVADFLDRVGLLEDRLGPVLFQLPPRWGADGDRLESFLSLLPGDRRFAVEFRDPSWFRSEIIGLLERHGAAFCISDFDGRLSPREVTAEFVYVRLHGPEDPYKGSYDTRTLSGWAGAFSSWAGQGRDIFCYFDNDEAGYAARNARVLKEMLGI